MFFKALSEMRAAGQHSWSRAAGQGCGLHLVLACLFACAGCGRGAIRATVADMSACALSLKEDRRAECGRIVPLRGGGYDPFAKAKEGAGAGGKGGMSEAERRIADIEAEMARTQKNKATMSHLCALKARLASLKRTVVEQQTKRSTGPGEGFDVRATGDARVGFIGFPSVGKSTLLTQLTGVHSEAADYEFTTLTCIPGVMHHEGARIQILDLPGIIEGVKDGKGRGRQVRDGAHSGPDRYFSIPLPRHRL